MIDIVEQELVNMSEKLFNVLLMYRTTKKNICWATDQYKMYGSSYHPQEPISLDLITGYNTKIIRPRVAKDMKEQTKRTKEKAEVYTPSWICNEQNNLIDEAWFGRKDVFNISNNQGWSATKEPIKFPKNKDWRKSIPEIDKQLYAKYCLSEEEIAFIEEKIKPME